MEPFTKAKSLNLCGLFLGKKQQHRECVLGKVNFPSFCLVLSVENPTVEIFECVCVTIYFGNVSVSGNININVNRSSFRFLVAFSLSL